MSRLPFICIICWAATSFTTQVAAAFAWDSFPNCAEPLLERYAPPACDFGVNPGYELNHTNGCLCSNQRFLETSSVAIYIVCGCIDLNLSANQLVTNCDGTDTPLILGVDEFISIGDGSQSSCTTQSLSTSNSPAAKSGPNTDLIVGLAVGIPAGLIALVALVVTILQLLVAQRAIPEGASPWPIIRDSFQHWFCCCARHRQRDTQPVVQRPATAQVPGSAP